MIRRNLFRVLLLFAIPVSLPAALPPQQECYVFINSAIPEQLALFHQFNDEYYLSRTLQNKGRVIFINIGYDLLDNNRIISVINDTQGIWLTKFKPHTLPTLYSVSHTQRSQPVIATLGEIRQCLQGK